MTEIEPVHVPALDAVAATQRELMGWFLDAALPLWDEHGVDRVRGGYFETLASIDSAGTLRGAGEVRRGRVVARQLYVFDVGQRLGWRSKRTNPVKHGCDYLFAHLHRGDGLWNSAVDAVTREPRASFSLYEQAFYLFALARLHPALGNLYSTAATAAQSLRRLRAGWGKPIGGFEEASPPSLPLKSNPHMHLLEAALAWLEVAEGAEQAVWAELACEVVGLCLSRFRDARTGAIRENFDCDWRPAPADEGRIVEPGHQFEWAWLLMQWSTSQHSTATQRSECIGAASRLLDIGERWGVDERRGVAINELWDDLRPKDATAKLWPQTERLKAWCARLDHAQSAAEAGRACRRIEAAARGLMKYLRTDRPGLWHEVSSTDGTFATGPSRASSFYHIVHAIAVLKDAVVRVTSRELT